MQNRVIRLLESKYPSTKSQLCFDNEHLLSIPVVPTLLSGFFFSICLSSFFSFVFPFSIFFSLHPCRRTLPIKSIELIFERRGS